MTYTGTSRLADFVRGLGALMVFGFLLVGSPVAMYKMNGSPIPDRIPSGEEIRLVLMRQDTDHSVFLATLWLIGWGAWCVFVLSVCADVISFLVGRETPLLPRPVRPLQQLTRELITTAALAFSVAASLATSASAATDVHAATGVHAAADPQPNAPGHLSSGHATPEPEPTASEWTPLLANEAPPGPETGGHPWQTHTVKRGDTLWNLARRIYGSGAQYPKIFKASQGIKQPHGAPALTDPDVLHPGQRVRLPRLGSPKSASSPPRTTPHAARPSAPPKHGKTSDARTPPTLRSSSVETRPSEVPAPVVAPPASPAPSTPHHQGDHQDDHHSPQAISLSSGSWIGIGLAAALSVAVAATRLHRRRRRPINTDSNSWGRATEPPIPDSVRKARQAHMSTYADRDVRLPSDPELVREDLEAAEPNHLVIGVRDGHAVAVPLAGLSLGLSGDGAHAAARAITTELLAKAHRYRAEIVIPRADAQALFPGEDITDLAAALDACTITPSLPEATSHLEAELLHRGRLLAMTDLPDVPSLRAADPAEPLPTVMLIASVPEQDAGAVHVLSTLGHRHNIGVLVLGAWPSGTSVELSGDATVTNAHGPDAGRFTGSRLFQLTTDDAAGMLQTIRTATGTEPGVLTPPPNTNPEPDPEPHVVPAVVPPPRPSGETGGPPARLDVLGHVCLRTPDGPINTGLRRSARSLLAYLSLHPDGVARDTATAELWPDLNPKSAVTRFNSAVTNIRSVLRATTGGQTMYIIHSDGRYRVDPGAVGVDLWALTSAVADARQATDDAARIKALTLAVDLYTGEFASGISGAWVEAHREHLRRAIGNACTDLAQLLQENDPQQALAALEQAITHDPYAEPLYQHIMRLQARLNRPDAVQRTYRFLAVRLEEIDAEPSDESRKLANFPAQTLKRT
ncbi:BTAD domain-containing putative transcriptional regulator [Actinomadura violacea]|uniref:LysM peptidoglycan-binding domain-containing protein n=1 Tax=Actinomadura violacea TaxID=2819934 RepID=A0ABS3SAC9_9ACTN|nr:BTAD domain-containing putative transcriptional regulator [Actinomadura violacea]MBO2465982.1 LysM peptidoglycan-binding domain-containing protein [Actinomadura violacea]